MSNPGSAMRDHLANERTLLAWLRTGLAFMAFGIAVEKFSVFLHFTILQSNAGEMEWNPMSARVLALTLILFGGVLCFAGAVRTSRWSRQAASLDGAPATWPLMSVALVTCLVSAMLMLHVMLSGF